MNLLQPLYFTPNEEEVDGGGGGGYVCVSFFRKYFSKIVLIKWGRGDKHREVF